MKYRDVNEFAVCSELFITRKILLHRTAAKETLWLLYLIITGEEDFRSHNTENLRRNTE